jgi:plasmid stability protein
MRSTRGSLFEIQLDRDTMFDLRQRFFEQHRNDYFADRDLVEWLIGSCHFDQVPFAVLLRRFLAKIVWVAPEKLLPAERNSVIAPLIKASVPSGRLPVDSPSWLDRRWLRGCHRLLRRDIEALTGNVYKDDSKIVETLVERLLGLTSTQTPSEEIGLLLRACTHILSDEAAHRSKTTIGERSAENAPHGLLGAIGTAIELQFCPERILRPRRLRFLEKRRDLFLWDSDFVEAVFDDFTEEERRITVILRRMLADECHVAPEKITELDRLGRLHELSDADFDRHEVFPDHLEALTGAWFEMTDSALSILSEYDPNEFVGEWTRESSRLLIDELKNVGYRII